VLASLADAFAAGSGVKTCAAFTARATVKTLSDRQSKRGRNFLILKGTFS